MIKITIHRHADKYKGFEIKGHAGYAADEDDDIICAAVSVLAVNTVNSLEILSKDKISYSEKNGFVSCSFDHLSEKGTLLVDSMILGLKQICESYGNEYTELKFKEV